jgi:two-component sensor histidine kinase
MASLLSILVQSFAGDHIYMCVEKHIIAPPKLTGYIWFALFLFVLCSPAFGQQEFTAEDSATFQQALPASRSDDERINYELELAEYSIRKRGSFKADLDNARMWIDRAKTLNEKLQSKEAEGHILLEEAYLQQEYGPSPEGKEDITRAVALLKNASDQCLLATAYKASAYYYNEANPKELPQKIALYKQSAMLFKQCGNMMKAAAVIQHLAEFYEDDANYAPAVKAINESLAIYDSLHYPKVQGLYDLMATVYADQADYNDAIKYELQALKISNQQKDSTMQFCETNTHLGYILSKNGQSREAIPYYNTALLIAQKHRDINNALIVTVNLVNAYVGIHELKEAVNLLDESAGSYGELADTRKLVLDGTYIRVLVKLHQLNRANVYAERILQLIGKGNIDKKDLTSSYTAMLVYYFATKNYSQELTFLIKNQKLTDEMGSPSDREFNIRYWYQMDSVKGDYKNAFTHLLAYKTLHDSIFNETKSRQIAQMRIQFETQQKEDSLRLKSQDIEILTQDAKLDQAQLKGARLSRNMFLAGIIVFVLITVMQYRRYREKQKLNTLITDKNTVLQKLVNEKEWLLKEVHHRVKNNLHTVICLLETQAAYLENDALEAVESSQHRIYAMSLIHQRLYQSTDIQTIDMSHYLPEFILYLKESFGTPRHIHFQQEIDAIKLDVGQAIPLALIVNEAVTNAIKYAFPRNRAGIIKIALLQQDDSIRLQIEDNGIGLPAAIKPDESASLGLELMRGLTDDLKGDIQFLSENGTHVMVSFKNDSFLHDIA